MARTVSLWGEGDINASPGMPKRKSFPESLLVHIKVYVRRVIQWI
jgi:hypothetical protein